MEDTVRNPPTDQEIVAAYLANYAGDQAAFWAYEEACELLDSDPERLWRITLLLIEHASDEVALAYVAAGPLEDMLAQHGPAFIQRVEALARRDSRFRLALSGVWGHTSFNRDVYERIQAVIRA
jgi:hypothetical protein